MATVLQFTSVRFRPDANANSIDLKRFNAPCMVQSEMGTIFYTYTYVTCVLSNHNYCIIILINGDLHVSRIIADTCI